jgi:hypothetical protein
MPDASYTFASPSKRPLRDGTRLTPRPPLLGFVLVCASLPTCLRSSTPGVATEAASPSGIGCHTDASRSALVVSHHLDGFLRSQVPGLLHPGAGCEVRRVSATTDCLDPKIVQTGQVTFPSAHSHPSKTCSSPAAVPHHCGRCPPAVHRERISRETRPSTTSVPSRCRGCDAASASGHRLCAAPRSHHRSHCLERCHSPDVGSTPLTRCRGRDTMTLLDVGRTPDRVCCHREPDRLTLV